MKRAQASMEYLMMVGVAFMILVPMMYIFYDFTISTREEISLAKLDSIGQKIVNTAEEVYFLGSPSRMTIHYTMPENVKGMEIKGDDILVFYYNAPAGEPGSKQVIIPSNVNLKFADGSIDELFSSGRKSIVIEAQPPSAGIEWVALKVPSS